MPFVAGEVSSVYQFWWPNPFTQDLGPLLDEASHAAEPMVRLTHRWREPDSNFESRFQKNGVPTRITATDKCPCGPSRFAACWSLAIWPTLNITARPGSTFRATSSAEATCRVMGPD